MATITAPPLDDNLIARDLRHLWHPCSQMHDYTTFPPLVIKKAQGDYFELADGRRIIDAISSWWCKSLGHNHPRLRQALLQQAEELEHVILVNATNTVIVELSEQIAQLTQQLKHVAYASDGSCAVEMAIKMSLHSRNIQGQTKRQKFAALENGYHGETCGALGMSDLNLYKQPYLPLLPKPYFIKEIPYVCGITDPLWHDCSDIWPTISAQLEPLAEELTAIIVEPIVQGAGGMKIYSADFLRRLRAWTSAHDIHLIADEIFTGFGPTGLPLACQHANIEPDFLCLGKYLTGGWLPLSALVTTSAIYQLFYADYALGKSFLHSHTFSGNILAAAVAVECFKVYRDEHIYQRIPLLATKLQNAMHKVAENTGKLQHIRGIGGIVAADLLVTTSQPRAGYKVYQRATELGAFLRPVGNTLYWLPPLNCSYDTIDRLQEITTQAILDTMT